MHSNSLLQGLNEAQRKAVLHGEGPALIAAGPGSGKTYTIVKRLLYLIHEKNVPPQKILVITFTKEAARSMQERFYKQFKQEKCAQIFLAGSVVFGTFHSFFYHIIKSIDQYSEYQLITQQEKLKIAKEVLNNTSGNDFTDADLHAFLRQVSFYKNTGHIQADESKAMGGCMKNEEWDHAFMEQLKIFDRLKKKYKRLDFDDMLWLCREALKENPLLCSYWQKQFSYILIDEFQDINPIQYEIIKMLSVYPYNLFAVGDDDQAIYGFRGSDAGILQKFLKDYPDAVQITLNINYRCSANIVQASKMVIEENEIRLHKELASYEKDASMGKIALIEAKDAKESYERIVATLKQKPLEDLDKEAVLFRTNMSLQMFAGILTQNHISFVLKEKGESIYEHFIVRDIMDYFQAAEGCRDRSLFLRIFYKYRLSPGREALYDPVIDLKKISDFYKQGFYENRQIAEWTEGFERHLQRLSQMRPALGIRYILHACDYQGYLMREKGTDPDCYNDRGQILQWLTEDAEDYTDFQSWRENLIKCKTDLDKGREKQKEGKKGIHLLTIHASKGLEFDKVYMMNLNEGILPKYRKGEQLSEERTEEERRLFYVGMTRAKKALELHYLVGTKENPRLPSRFLSKLIPRQ